ncbi:PorT family protein [Taibaiella lutea]|uniref:PorT family protein n=1 Tax=Taibaiella lutea TaxID=2608001 RepID=A0A5M6CN09_9BACT|nr:porin family protein [Taibaiella lutea]KAA5536396.1 PorT family protein [Taibaiella lutea]
MKRILLTIATVFVAQSIFAQMSIAPEAGINLSSLSIKDDNGNSQDISGKMGAKAGLYFNIPISNGFFIQPGILYSMKGGQETTTLSILGVTASSKTTISLNYLEIPLNLGYDFDMGNLGGIFVTVGPYLGYGLSGKTKGTLKITGMPDETTEEDINFGSGEDEIKALDYGLNFGAGYRTPFGIYGRIQYGLGLANLSNFGGDASMMNKGVSFTVGYAFKLKSK